MPTWAAPAGGSLPAAKVTNITTGQALSQTVLTKVTWNSELYDTASNFASNRFTATTAGYYAVTSSQSFDSAGGADIYYSIHKNGSEYQIIYFGTSSLNYPQANIDTMVYLNVSDYVEVFIQYYNGGGARTLNLGNTCWFAITGIRS